MFNFIKNHFFQYLIILLLFAITVAAIAANMALYLKIMYIGIALAVYFIWAIWHHWEDHKLNWKVVVEYGILTLILFWLLINLAI